VDLPSFAQKLQRQNAGFQFRLHFAFNQGGLRRGNGLNIHALLNDEALPKDQCTETGRQAYNNGQQQSIV